MLSLLLIETISYRHLKSSFINRCVDAMEKHLEQSVLSRLPYGYQSILKQSISSEEDDMGIDDCNLRSLLMF